MLRRSIPRRSSRSTGCRNYCCRAVANGRSSTGWFNAPLNAPAVVPSERRAEIAKTGVVADQAFREAVEGLRTIPAMKAGEPGIVEAEKAFAAFEAFRAPARR